MVVKQFKQTAIIIGEKYDEKLLDVIINYYKKDKMVIISVNKIFKKIHITAYCEEVGSDLINLVLELQCTNIITIGQINLEKNISLELFNTYNIHCFSLDGLNGLEKITNYEFSNIINFKLFVFLSVLNNDNYNLSNTIRSLIKMHDKYTISNLLIKNGFKIITYKNINKYLYLENKIFSDVSQLITAIRLLPPKNKILLGFHPWGLETIINAKLHINNKLVMWQDDLHWFSHFVKDRSERKIKVTNYDKKYSPRYLTNLLDYLITPSPIYFKNLNITEHDNKIKFLFYKLDAEQYNKLDYTNYKNRTSQIILSGAISIGYKSRTEFLNLKQSSDKFAKLIYHQPTPGYKNNEHMTEMNYYNKLAEYKGAFVGHYIFPLNFLLAKHIEVLMCGCLGFFEKNPLLKEQLGLIEFEHYIPCTDEGGNLIEDEKFYYDWLEKGIDIARKGAEYVRNKFGENYIDKYIDILKSFK